MIAAEVFRCPVCDFTIFNRRLAKCEHCGSDLPAHLRFSPDEIAQIEADHDSNAQIREKLAEDEAEQQALAAAGRRASGEVDGLL